MVPKVLYVPIWTGRWLNAGFASLRQHNRERLALDKGLI